jgi:hypothetical protein
MRRGWVGPFILLLAAQAAACGDDAPSPRDSSSDAGADAGPKPSGVDPELRLDSLSAEQSARVCGALSARLDRLLSRSEYLRVSCTQQAWPVSLDISNITGEIEPSPARCEEFVAMCLKNDGALGEFTPTHTLGADLIDPAHCTTPTPGLDLTVCDATVGDLEQCGAAAAKALGERFALVDCDVVADQAKLDQAAHDIDLGTLRECDGLQARCPGLRLDSQPDGKPPLEH